MTYRGFSEGGVSPVSLFFSQRMCLAYLAFAFRFVHSSRMLWNVKHLPHHAECPQWALSTTHPHGTIPNSSIANAQRMHRQFHMNSPNLLVCATMGAVDYRIRRVRRFRPKVLARMPPGAVLDLPPYIMAPPDTLCKRISRHLPGCNLPSLPVISALFEGWVGS